MKSHTLRCSSPCWTVDGSNRIIKTCSEGSQTIFYDAAANLAADGLYNYTWDAESRMATGAGVTFYCDGDGRRMRHGGLCDPICFLRRGR